MAFLLAKFQRAYWDERAAWLRSPEKRVAWLRSPEDAAVASGNPTAATAVEPSTTAALMTPPQGNEVQAQAATPKKGRRRARSEELGAPLARKASRKAATTGGGVQMQKQPLNPKPEENMLLITSTMLVNSVRLQQLMERQREQFQLQQKQQLHPQQFQQH